MSDAWRPLHRSLAPEAVALHDEQRAKGWTPLPVHLMLVNDAENERARTACGGGLGEWVSGDIEQITCKPCVEQVHA